MRSTRHEVTSDSSDGQAVFPSQPANNPAITNHITFKSLNTLVSLYISIRVLHGMIFYRVPPIPGMPHLWDGGFEMGASLIWLFFTNPNAKVCKQFNLIFKIGQ